MTTLSLKHLIRPEVRFQPTLSLPHTHIFTHTFVPDQFSHTTLSSMLHWHYHTPPTHCNAHRTVCACAACIEENEREEANENAKRKASRWQTFKVFIDKQKKRQKHNRQQLTEPVCKFCRSPASVQKPRAQVFTPSVLLCGDHQRSVGRPTPGL